MKTNSTPAPADAASASAAPAIREEPINILIVDDEPKNLTVLETVLDDPSYRLVRAESAEQALLALVNEEFALLILDIQMPGMTGFELAHMIKDRKKTARIPIIFLTAYYNEDQHVLEGYGTGAVDYLHKPVNAAILRSKVAVFAELHRKSRQCQQLNGTLLAEVTQRRMAEQQLRELNESLEERVAERTEALREREHFLQRMTDVSPSIIVVFDLEEERCVFINRTVAFVLGYSAEEIAAMGDKVVPTLMHPDDLARFPAHLERGRMLRDDETADFEHRLRDRAGEWHWFHNRDAVFARDAAGAVRQLIGTANEITARKQAEVALRASEQFNRTVLESSPDCVKVLDAEGRLVFMNQNGQCLMEIDDFAALRGQPWWQLWPEAERAQVRAAVEKGLRGEVARFVAPGLTCKGNPRCWDVIVAPVVPAGGEGVVTSLISVSRDITESKAAEESLRRAAEELARSARAKDDFLAALSHELRTPLTPVLMTATALEGDMALPPEVREQLSMMRRNIELEARLIDDLLDITRISSGKLTIASVPADLHLLLDHTSEIVRSDGLGKQVRVAFMLDAARHHALADPTRLQQVFWNLLKNALKFTPAGGTITVRTRNDDEGWIAVSVEDTGIGIAANALPHIFKAFEQGDIAGQHRYGGLGLGLAISRAIVEAHGGTIQADSKGAGLGATFTVILARIDAPAEVPPATTPPSAPAPALRLLVVEDHEATRSVLERLLTRSGHLVTTASTVQDALGAYKAARFDAVISDLGLPDGSGIELMVQIQRIRPVPAIALSGYGMEDDLQRSKEAGCFAHLVKPVNFDQLRQLLDQLATRV